MLIDSREVDHVATAMVVVLTYWLSFEYVRDPRKALEPESAGAALLRGAFHVLSLLLPYLEPAEREHLHNPAIAGRYNRTLYRRQQPWPNGPPFPHDAADYTFDAASAEEELGAPARRRRRAAAQGRQGAGRLGAVPRRRIPEGDRGRPEGGRRRRHHGRQQGAGDLRHLPRSSEKTKLALFMEVAERAEKRTQEDPKDANAWYCMAYALGRYSQGISIAKALAQGLGSKVKNALETTIRLAPKHADAHIALGAFHAEVIDKVGSLLGRTQGASKDAGLAMFKTALKLNPTSAIAMIEYANGLVMLEGDKRMKEATQLYEDAAACEPMDAMERLDVEMAKAELED